QNLVEDRYLALRYSSGAYLRSLAHQAAPWAAPCRNRNLIGSAVRARWRLLYVCGFYDHLSPDVEGNFSQRGLSLLGFVVAVLPLFYDCAASRKTGFGSYYRASR